MSPAANPTPSIPIHPAVRIGDIHMEVPYLTRVLHFHRNVLTFPLSSLTFPPNFPA